MNIVHRITVLVIISAIVLIAQSQDTTHPNKIRRQRFTCPEKSAASNCNCVDDSSETTFSCPNSNPTLEVTVLDHSRVYFKCYDDAVHDFRKLPNITIGNVSLLSVTDCMLDEGRPILETFGFLGVTNVRNLGYYNYKKAVQYNAGYFEGLEQLENLTLSRGVESLEKDTFSRFHNLKRLTIDHNSLDLLPGTFETLENLTYLGLDYNQINELKPGLFNGLRNLEALSLSFNKIKNLSAGSFNGLNSIRMLNLRVNYIESFDVETFAELTELSRLEITLNQFASLPSGLFSRNAKLKTLILTNNRKLATLPEELLANLQKLTIINLSHNGIRQLPQSLFRGSSGVTELNLGNNRLESLPEELLSDQQQLQVLKLDHNQLESIPEYFLERNVELQTLHLSHNQLKSLSEKVFSKLTNLKELHLENNRLLTIPQFVFSGTPKLEELYMQNNLLAWHKNSFKHEELSFAENDNTPFQVLTKLRILNLKNNSILTIFQDWYINNLELQTLDLSFNKISALSDTQLQFQSNITMNLSNNEISQIVFLYDLEMQPSQIINVDLNNNPLNCNCNTLKFVQLVQSKSKNGLQFTIDQLHCVEPSNLQDISIDHLQTKDLLCDFESAEDCPKKCQCAMRTLDYTVIVNCSGRGLTEVPELPTPSKLHESFNSLELHIENNLLIELPNLTRNREISQIYASNNSIRELLPQNIPPSLRFMDLSHNKLQMIDDQTLITLNLSTHLETLQLSQNQWLCDCPASNFLIFVQQNSRLISDMSAVLCHPSGRSLDSITVNDLCYKDYTTRIVISFMVAAFGLLVGLISVLFFRYQTEVKVWLFTHNLFLSLITEEELDKDKLYDAFISYSHLDEEFIVDELIPKLENEPMNFKTCWHVRDFMPGEMIMTQIIKSIEASRRTVIVLSKNFLESSWAKQEFRQAHVQSMEENRVRVIVVIYDDIGDIDNLDGDLKAYLKTKTYVKWGDPWFWQKLRYAMPHSLKVKGIKSAVSEIKLEQVKTMDAPTAV
ncbi:protein toll-like [Aedes albopictus]|uniref:TIR domain-containing protein n=1 Tax=Aedes albopictus TaxID=7160 RepID=A0ABM1XP01_AEDAL|nr:protein toll-like [Aedes albopictus]XP_029711923.1 protein toll-like [Aedes albopictus]